jgi:hypothetical protein
MRRLATISILLGLVACSKKESASSGVGSAQAGPEAAPPAPPPKPPEPPPAAKNPEEEVADLVVQSVGSKALGSQTIEASCVSVGVVPVGKWTVAAARLKDCGDKTARSLVWLYKRADGGKWNEDYAGQPPKCWKGVPPDIAQAVKALTKIPTC